VPGRQGLQRRLAGGNRSVQVADLPGLLEPAKQSCPQVGQGPELIFGVFRPQGGDVPGDADRPVQVLAAARVLESAAQQDSEVS
jgi:hypothetical protein